jgi:hypothetical protein
VAFDLVITSVVFRGWSWSGALALLVAAAVSAAIGLDVARVWTMPALHAAPAITLAAFGAHLMWCRRVDLTVLLQGAADTARAEERAARLRWRRTGHRTRRTGRRRDCAGCRTHRAGHRSGAGERRRVSAAAAHDRRLHRGACGGAAAALAGPDRRRAWHEC